MMNLGQVNMILGQFISLKGFIKMRKISLFPLFQKMKSLREMNAV